VRWWQVRPSARLLSTPANSPAPPPTLNTDPFSLAKYLSGKHLYGGSFRSSLSQKNFDVKNPATGQVIAQAAYGEDADVGAAVEAADKAQHEWKERAVRARGGLLTRCGALLQQYAEELARLTSLETGKALRTESRVEASVLADVFAFYGGLASEMKGETIPFNPNSLTYTIREPVGIVGAIIPWNAPLLLMALKIAPALAMGNTVVVKSAEEAPLGVLRVAELLNTVLPAGVMNIVSGFGRECGRPLVAHPKVKKVTFTGSVETGRDIYKTAAEKLIPVTLELGGKSPMIVLPDADLKRAIDGAILGMRFTRQGQSCTAASRMFVHEKIYDAFVDQLKERVNALKMGDPLDETTDIGTIISHSQLSKVQHYIDLGSKEKGVEMHQCSALPKESHLSKDLFVRPVLFTGISNSSSVAREEIFGPVACIIKWSDWDTVLREANDSNFGLSASVWTNDLRKALQAVKYLEAGIVQVNQNAVVQPNLPVGGLKSSGIGKEASLEAMLEHFTHKKTVSINFS
jgi:acyl-CoA reductase-like NAD-dependent aldehyde dehydrogenase